MSMDEKYRDVLNVLRNQTKMKIVTLLINYKKMTVTGMAKYIKTTRSNLYQIMTELVSTGIVNEPEIRPKKNYVEKYYSLNKDYFAFQDEKIDNEIKGLPDTEFRETLASFLTAQSLNISILASSVENMALEEIREIRNQHEPNIMSYGTISREGALSVTTVLKKELMNTIGDNGDESTFLFLLFPSRLLTGKE